MQIRQPLTWCSFSDGECLGVCVLDGELNPLEAAERTYELGCNPGGELMTMHVDLEASDELYAAMLANRNRLISPEESQVLFNAQRALL